LKNKGRLGVIFSLAILLILDALIEIQFLEIFYQGIPIPFQETSKPIGSSLFSLTFFHILLIVLNILAISYLLNRFGFQNKIFPSSPEGKMDFGFLIAFSLSGLLMWYFPIFLLSFITTGAYFIIVELK
jgi:hypothetical protein